MSESETDNGFENYVHNVNKICERWEQAIADEKEKKAIFKDNCMGKIKKLRDTGQSLANMWTEISAASLRLDASIKPDGYLAEYAELCK
jgi:hypothetical protein